MRSRMFAPRTSLTEQEMVHWAEQGITCLRDIMLGTRVVTATEFAEYFPSEHFPSLDSALIAQSCAQ